MKVKRHELDIAKDCLGVIDETDAKYGPACPANIGPSAREYRPCGEPMRVRKKTGITICKVHGEMH